MANHFIHRNIQKFSHIEIAVLQAFVFTVMSRLKFFVDSLKLVAKHKICFENLRTIRFHRVVYY